MTSIAPAAASAAANPPDTRAKANRRPGEAEFSLAALSPTLQLPAALDAPKPPVPVGSSKRDSAEAAPAPAQVSSAAEVVSATTAAEARLTERRSAEQPNQVNLAQRAAGELAAPRDPLGLIPPPAQTAGPGPDPAAARKPTEPGKDAEPGNHRPTEPGPRSSTPVEPVKESTPARAVDNRRANAATPQVAAVQPTAAATGQPPGLHTGPARAASVASSAGPVTAVARMSGAETAGPRSATHATAVREGLWRHLGRLGQHGPAARAAAGAKAGPAPEAYAKVEAQVARGLAAALQQKEGKVTLRLAPEALGRLRIDLAISDQRITAHISTQREQARRLLKDNVDSLRAALEAQGLGVERIEVVGGPAEPAAAPHRAHADNPAGAPGGDGPWNGPSHGSHEAGPGSHGGPGGQGGSRDGPARADDQSVAAEPPAEGDVYFLRIDFLA